LGFSLDPSLELTWPRSHLWRCFTLRDKTTNAFRFPFLEPFFSFPYQPIPTSLFPSPGHEVAFRTVPGIGKFRLGRCVLGFSFLSTPFFFFFNAHFWFSFMFNFSLLATHLSGFFLLTLLA